MKEEELKALLDRGADHPALGPIEEHLHALATDEHLPEMAIVACTVRFEESRPALRAVLIRAADGEPLSDDEATLLFRGLHVLGGSRDPEACRPLLRLLRRPEEELDFLLGDLVTEILPRIAAGVFDGDAEALFEAIADPAIDEFGREALLDAATFLAWDGRIDGDRMRAFLERFHRDRLAPDGDIAWIGWLNAIALLGLTPMAPLVHNAWDEGRILEGVLLRSDFEEDLAEAERAPRDFERFRAGRLGYIEDVLESLDWVRHLEPIPVDEGAEPFSFDAEPYAPMPVINPLRHVGRNDPCPCGSGKKFKKCCLGK